MSYDWMRIWPRKCQTATVKSTCRPRCLKPWTSHGAVLLRYASFAVLLTVLAWAAAVDKAAAQPPLADAAAAEATASGSTDPNTLVLEAVRRAVWGPSLTCRIQQETKAFDQTMTGIGQYSHVGGGNGQVKVVMRYSSGKSQSTFVQLSDGVLLWSISNDGTPPKRVYLGSIRRAIGSVDRTPESSASTSLYLAIGGQAELLRTLYHRYRWFKIYAAEIEGQPVWCLVGTLRGSIPEPNSQTLVDGRMFNFQPSEAIPSDARITMFRGGPRNLVPIKVEYFKRVLDSHGQLAQYKPVSTIEYSDIQVGIHIDESEFAFDDEAANVEDETSEYMPLYPVAEASVPLNR